MITSTRAHRTAMTFVKKLLNAPKMTAAKPALLLQEGSFLPLNVFIPRNYSLSSGSKH